MHWTGIILFQPNATKEEISEEKLMPEKKTKVKFTRYSFGENDWGCGKLPNGDRVYDGEEIVANIETGEEWSAATALQKGFEFVEEKAVAFN